MEVRAYFENKPYPRLTYLRVIMLGLLLSKRALNGIVCILKILLINIVD